MIKYAIIQVSSNTVSGAGVYDGDAWSTFKSSYEEQHNGDTLIDIGNSSFPDGQGWYQCSDGTFKPKSSPTQTIDITKNNLIIQIQRKTDMLRFGGFFTVDGKKFKKNQEYVHDIGLLSALRENIAPSDYPIHLSASEPLGQFQVFNNATDVLNFSLDILKDNLSIINSNTVEISKINTISSIEDAVKYNDHR